jgi:hypothetical protein
MDVSESQGVGDGRARKTDAPKIAQHDSCSPTSLARCVGARRTQPQVTMHQTGTMLRFLTRPVRPRPLRMPRDLSSPEALLAHTLRLSGLAHAIRTRRCSLQSPARGYSGSPAIPSDSRLAQSRRHIVRHPSGPLRTPRTSVLTFRSGCIE